MDKAQVVLCQFIEAGKDPSKVFQFADLIFDFKEDIKTAKNLSKEV